MFLPRIVAKFSALIALSAQLATADVVTEWNDTYLDIIRQTGGAPCPLSRDGPMFNIAMYDAINSIDAVLNYSASYKPYQQSLPTPLANTSREAAAAAAAYTVMSNLHSGNAANLGLIQGRYDQQINAIAEGAAKAQGIAFGQTVGTGILALRANDGHDASPAYTPGGLAGDWRVTPDGPNLPAFTPHWGNVTPWGIQSGSQFRPTHLTDMGSMENMMHTAEYAEQINGGPGIPGVKDLGSRTSATRTADETQAAWFWANDRNGTSKPPGQLIQLTKVVSVQQNLNLSQNARLYGLVGLALGDACVTAWDAKYNTPIDLWRPIDAVRETMNDGNAATTPVLDWLPLNDFTPPFPAYVSGHATFGAVHASIMEQFFGTDNITFTLGSDEFGVNPGLGYAANLTRTFTSFSDAAWENAMSRVWLGVHFEWDVKDGNTLGYDVGEYIFANNLQPVPEPGSIVLAGLGVAGLFAFARRRRRKQARQQ